MNAFASYIRHLLVTGILLLVEKWHLPVEGAEDAAHWIALSFIGTITWLVAKYGKDIIPLLRGANLFLLSVALAGLTMTASCVSKYRVDGSGRDWVNQPVQVLPASRVTPIADVPLPDELGGGTIEVPIVISPQK